MITIQENSGLTVQAHGENRMYTETCGKNSHNESLKTQRVGSKILKWSNPTFINGSGSVRDYIKTPSKSWVEDLTTFGCVAKNPGPPKGGVPKNSQLKQLRRPGGGARKKPLKVLKNPAGAAAAGAAAEFGEKIAETGYKLASKAAKHLGKGAGKRGREIGRKIGEAFGGTAGEWFEKITGNGAYTVRHNTLMSNGPPIFNGADYTRICHREFLTDIESSIVFNRVDYEINPGVTASFPWLSEVAKNFEEYSFEGLVYEYKTTSATALSSTNPALGVVVMTTNYDVVDAPFATKQEMEAYQYTVSSVPCASCLHPVECDPRQNVLPTQYVRQSIVPLGTDQRFYDIGRLQVATQGMQVAGAKIGELWVSYSVLLRKPKLGLGAISHGSRYYGYVGTATATAYANMERVSSSSLDTYFRPDGALFFPHVGRFLVAYSYNTASTTSINIAGQVEQGDIAKVRTFHLVQSESTRGYQAFSSGASGADAYLAGVVSATGESNFYLVDVTSATDDAIYFSLTTAPATATECYLDLFVVSVDAKFGEMLADIRTPQQRLEHLEKLVAEMAIDSDDDWKTSVHHLPTHTTNVRPPAHLLPKPYRNPGRKNL